MAYKETSLPHVPNAAVTPPARTTESEIVILLLMATVAKEGSHPRVLRSKTSNNAMVWLSVKIQGNNVHDICIDNSADQKEIFRDGEGAREGACQFNTFHQVYARTQPEGSVPVSPQNTMVVRMLQLLAQQSVVS